MSLTREKFLAMDDITIKKVTFPTSIPVWGGEDVYIKQLNRGQQDAYLRRQFGDTRMRQDARARAQDISGMNIYGHDAWLCIRGACDERGQAIFTDKDEQALNTKNGEAIGWLAAQIIEFSGMGADVKVARGEMTPEDAQADEVKN